MSQAYKQQFAKGSSLYYSYFLQVSIYKNCLTAQCGRFLFTFSLNINKLTKPSLGVFFAQLKKTVSVCKAASYPEIVLDLDVIQPKPQIKQKNTKQLRIFLKRQLSLRVWTHCDTIQQCSASCRSRGNFRHVSSVIHVTDYGHTMAKSPILCGPN